MRIETIAAVFFRETLQATARVIEVTAMRTAARERGDACVAITAAGLLDRAELWLAMARDGHRYATVAIRLPGDRADFAVLWGIAHDMRPVKRRALAAQG